jgi:hypothetical protein
VARPVHAREQRGEVGLSHAPADLVEQRVQVAVEVGGTLVALLGIGAERAGQDLVQPLGRARAHLREPRHLRARDRHQRLARRRRLEEPPPGARLPEHHAQREQVHAVIDGVAARLLGRHVGILPFQ